MYTLPLPRTGREANYGTPSDHPQWLFSQPLSLLKSTTVSLSHLFVHRPRLLHQVHYIGHSTLSTISLFLILSFIEWPTNPRQHPHFHSLLYLKVLNWSTLRPIQCSQLSHHNVEVNFKIVVYSCRTEFQKQRTSISSTTFLYVMWHQHFFISLNLPGYMKPPLLGWFLYFTPTSFIASLNLHSK